MALLLSFAAVLFTFPVVVFIVVSMWNIVLSYQSCGEIDSAVRKNVYGEIFKAKAS